MDDVGGVSVFPTAEVFALGGGGCKIQETPAREMYGIPGLNVAQLNAQELPDIKPEDYQYFSALMEEMAAEDEALLLGRSQLHPCSATLDRALSCVMAAARVARVACVVRFASLY